MIYDQWFGVFNKKGELMSVDESEQIAHANADALELVKNVRTNTVIPVTIVNGTLLDFVVMILDAAKTQIDERRITRITENARAFDPEKAKKEIKND